MNGHEVQALAIDRDEHAVGLAILHRVVGLGSHGLIIFQ